MAPGRSSWRCPWRTLSIWLLQATAESLEDAMSFRSSWGGHANLQSPRLVGRSSELGEVDRQVEKALSGHLRVVVVGGGAGVGNTRLLSELLARHADHAFCLSGRCYRWGTATSFGP